MLHIRLPKEIRNQVLPGALPAGDKKPTVFVGMSGGVDSSTSALLLKEAGYDVVGVFIKVWSPDWLPCNWRDEQRDAMRVAADLNIPFFTFDFEEEYKRDVVDYMISEYKQGRTPNPDVMCNRSIKFGSFWTKARDMGAHYIATGHYAQIKKLDNSELRISNSESIRNPQSTIPQYELLAGADPNKDQSYFLWTLTQEDLAHTLFPIGHLTKPEVRAYAKEKNLFVADKKDSQGICFLGTIDLKEFLKYYLKPVPGKVLDETGRELGTHEGSILFTIGEAIPLGGLPSKMFVIAKDLEKNTLTVSPSRPHELESAQKNVNLVGTNWISKIPAIDDTVSARTRYRQPLENATIKDIESTEATIMFEKSQLVAPGQSTVFYQGDVCLGGGIIE